MRFLRYGSVVYLNYRQGAVKNLEEDSPEEWVATVLGTEDYTVEVTLEDDKVMD